MSKTPLKVISKWLYRNKHVISHTLHDVEDIGHRFKKYGNDIALFFDTQSNDPNRIHEQMVLMPAFYKEQESGFVVETFAYEEDEEADHEWCQENSKGIENSKVHSCYGKIALREMTEDESKQMEEFENETNGKLLSFAIAFASNLQFPWKLDCNG